MNFDNPRHVGMAIVIFAFVLSAGIIGYSSFSKSDNQTKSVTTAQVNSASKSSTINMSSFSLSSSSVVTTNSSSQSNITQVVSTTPQLSQSTASIQSTSPVIAQAPITEVIQDIPNVTKLTTDKSIHHQYIKDYLACPTKFYQTLNGGYIYDGLDQYQYKCIPQEEVDKCPSKSLLFGFQPIVGSTAITGDVGDKSKYKIIEKNKYYCVNYFETFGSVSMTVVSGYGWGYFPEALDKKLPGYFVIPKSILPYKFNDPNPKVTFAAIPLSSFSQADQEYIAKNFVAK
jgi:hypothetical protein